MTHPRTIVMIAGMLLALLSACAPQEQAIAVTATDFKYDSTTWTARRGQKVTLTFTNNGANEHEWVLLKAGTSVTLPFSDDDEDKVDWEIEAEPGQTTTGTLTAPSEPGTYTIVCGIPGHIEQGMQGTLTIE